MAIKKSKDDSSSDSESSDDDTDVSGKNQLPKVKEEKVTSESSSSSSGSNSSSSSDESDSENDLSVNRIKKEKEEDGSFAVPSLPIVSRPIKTEPMSDVEGGKPHKKKEKVSGKRTLSISEHLDSFLAEVTQATPEQNLENGAPKKKRKSTLLNETNLTDLTAAFQTPTMSSTLIPESTPAKVKKEVQSDDERPKKKKSKNSAKNSLENIESELFKSFTG